MKLMAIDGNSIINRAYYGIRPLTTRDGLYTHAVFGFLTTLLRLTAEEEPDALCVTFDLHAPTFRHKADAAYKATRKPMPEELRMQVPVLKEVLDALNIPRYELAGWEADDLLGTISRKCEAAGWECVLVTGDKDSLQLITDHTKVKLVSTRMGQTTTKDMIAAVLSEKFNVLKTEGNKNNDIGLPMTLLRLGRENQIAVVELGINHPGEMDYLSAIAQPDVVCITNIGDSHIEAFGCRENTLKAKLEVFDHAKPGCTAVLNGDDELLRAAAAGPDISWTGSTILVGRGEGLDYRADGLESDWRSQMSCQVTTPKGDCHMDIPGLGEHMVYPTLLATAVGEKFGMTLEEIAAGVRNFAPTKMRMNILPRQEGKPPCFFQSPQKAHEFFLRQIRVKPRKLGKAEGMVHGKQPGDLR